MVLLALFCVSCRSKPGPSPSVNLLAQTAQTQQATVQPRAKLVLIPAPPEKPKEPISHQAAATIPGAQRILFAVASPETGEVLGLAQMTHYTYGGRFFLLRPDRAEHQAEEVMDGMNLTAPDAPVWSPDGGTAYFVFDGNHRRTSDEHSHGLFAWDRGTGKVTQVLKDSIGGLAISPDGMLLGFWDYSTGDQLTVYNLKTRQVVRAWAGQVHSEDDLILSDLAFTPDGKSLLARLYVPKEDSVLQFDMESGKIPPFAKDVQSLVTVGDSVYLLQFVPVPFTMPEHPHKLTKWMAGNAEPVTVLEDFPYEQLTGSNGNPWLVARRARNYSAGIAIYDTKTGQIQTAGKSCDTAIVTSSGKVLYAFGSELVADPAVCSGPPPKQD